MTRRVYHDMLECDDNLGHCRPYESKYNDRVYYVDAEGEIISLRIDGVDYDQIDTKIIHRAAIAALKREEDYNDYAEDDWDDEDVLRDACEEKSCRLCAWFYRCDAMSEPVEGDDREPESDEYNTDTSECLGSIEDNIEDRHSYSSESLYRNNDGEFFLFCSGGPGSRFGRTDPRDCETILGDEFVRPLSYEEAAKWAETNLDGDEYEAIFGEVEE